MTDRQQEIDNLLSMFHDFDIVTAELNGDTLVFAITIPWGSMWKKDDYSYTIRLELMGCNYFNCDYYKIKSKEVINIDENRYQRETDKITTTNVADLTRLELSIQSKANIRPDTYELHCQCGNQDIDFATITLSTTDYRIFDQDGKEITLETMKQWATDWWDGIQKMWDEDKKQRLANSSLPKSGRTWWQKLFDSE
ncbi:MAG: hypothetical protein V4714_01435 [Bacteroidota bacterium]